MITEISRGIVVIPAGQLYALGAAIGVLTVAFVLTALLYLINYKEVKLLKDYLRRRKALNDYEDWKKDRQIDI